jgi:hypothetical protein
MKKGAKTHAGEKVGRCRKCELPLCHHNNCINIDCSEFVRFDTCFHTYRGTGPTQLELRELKKKRKGKEET